MKRFNPEPGSLGEVVAVFLLIVMLTGWVWLWTAGPLAPGRLCPYC